MTWEAVNDNLNRYYDETTEEILGTVFVEKWSDTIVSATASYDSAIIGTFRTVESAKAAVEAANVTTVQNKGKKP